MINIYIYIYIYIYTYIYIYMYICIYVYIYYTACNIFSSITPVTWFVILALNAAGSFWQIILLSMLAQHRLHWYFDKKKLLKKRCVVVLFEWEEQQDNKLISPHQMRYSVRPWEQKLQNIGRSMVHPRSFKILCQKEAVIRTSNTRVLSHRISVEWHNVGLTAFWKVWLIS